MCTSKNAGPSVRPGNACTSPAGIEISFWLAMEAIRPSSATMTGDSTSVWPSHRRSAVNMERITAHYRRHQAATSADNLHFCNNRQLQFCYGVYMKPKSLVLFAISGLLRGGQ